MNSKVSFHTWAQTLSAMSVPTLVILLVEKYPHWDWFPLNPIEATVGGIFILLVIASIICIFLDPSINFNSSNKFRRRLYGFIAIASAIGLIYLAIMPYRFPIEFKPEVTVKICGSTTLGEDYATQIVDIFAKKNHAGYISVKHNNKTAQGINTTIDVSFTKKQKDQRVSGFPNISKARFIIDAQGTENGIDQVLKNKCDISMASTSTENKDVDKLSKIPIAQDAIVIISSDHSRIGSLEYEKLKSIFSGEDSSWKVFSRDASTSGTAKELMKYLKLNKFPSSLQTVNTNFDMLVEVAETDGAIGYLSYSFINYIPKNVKVIAVKENERVKELPEPVNIVNNRSAMVRELSLYLPLPTDTKSLSFEIAESLADFARRTTGQAALRGANFIPITDKGDYWESWQSSDDRSPNIKINEVYNHETKRSALHIVQFNKDTDVPSKQERDELFKWVNEQSKEEPLILIGHTDSEGNPRYNIGLSIERAEEVSTILKEKGFFITAIYGFGAKFQESSPDTSRRVEIYSLNKLKEVAGIAQ